MVPITRGPPPGTRNPPTQRWTALWSSFLGGVTAPIITPSGPQIATAAGEVWYWGDLADKSIAEDDPERHDDVRCIAPVPSQGYRRSAG